VPEAAGKVRNLRYFSPSRLATGTVGIAGLMAQLERFRPAPENRGVPGSSPGLAIRKACKTAVPDLREQVQVRVTSAAATAALRVRAHRHLTGVRQQVQLELALHVIQAVPAQPRSHFALVVLVRELRDGRDLALEVMTRPRCQRGSG
jgi:hypothetical protein